MAGAWPGDLMCSTPFGITEFRGLCSQFQPQAVNRCSTPFGITEFRGLLSVSAKQSDSRCSTPFGITEFRGVGWTRTRRNLRRAQRLSASRSFAAYSDAVGNDVDAVLNAFRHHGVSRGGRKNVKYIVLPCSTPFGITEFRGTGAPSRPRICGRAQRLSASRSFAARQAGQLRHAGHGAQRLSASRSFAGRSPGTSRSLANCAQRLSASRSFADSHT